MSRKQVWSGFTDVELSMIASHLAGGGQLCCDPGKGAVYTITAVRSRRRRLAEEAYERFECTTKSPEWLATWTARDPAYARGRIAEEIAYCLEKFLDTI